MQRNNMVNELVYLGALDRELEAKNEALTAKYEALTAKNKAT